MIIDVLEGDVLEKRLDVLVLKYADAPHGVDRNVSAALGISLAVPRGQHRFFPTSGKLNISEILVVGVGPLNRFDYRQIWEFAETALATIERERPQVRRIGITIHGPGYGLDELASVDSVVNGLHAAFQKNPSSILGLGDFRVEIVELNRRRAARLRKYLAASTLQHRLSAPREQSETFSPETAEEISNGRTYSKRLFAAMPFSDDYLDQWELAIQPAAHDNKLVIERLDHEQFTGDIVSEIRTRIERSAAVVALLDAHNPNVFLEVGYAWGVKKPAILLLHEDHEPPFDVKNQKLIRYKRVGQLKTVLTSELKGLLAKAAI